MGGVKVYAIAFLPSHKTLMKKLLMEAHGEEGEFTSKMAMIREEFLDLERKAKNLVAQLHDMKSSL